MAGRWCSLFVFPILMYQAALLHEKQLPYPKTGLTDLARKRATRASSKLFQFSKDFYIVANVILWLQ